MEERYNNLLKRYFNGCKYIEEHRDQFDKYIDTVLELLQQINNMIKEYHIPEENILKGF